MEIRCGELTDLEPLLSLFDEAKATIADLGIDQWQTGGPCRETVLEDIRQHRCRVVVIDGQIAATFVTVDYESTYDTIYNGSWVTKGDYIALHRFAIAVKWRGKGIAEAILEEAAKIAGDRSLRIDTHPGNVVMRKMLAKNGFAYCGEIFLQNGDLRVAYEKLLHPSREQIIRQWMGRPVHLVIDRPVGYCHKGMVYPVNYGYIPGTLAADEEPVDVYVLGVTEPLKTFDGWILAAVCRADDVEDKLIAAPVGQSFRAGQIAEAIRFQEQYFQSTLLLPE